MHCLMLVLTSRFGHCRCLREEAPAKLKDQVQPVYPEMAKTMDITGVVRLEIIDHRSRCGKECQESSVDIRCWPTQRVERRFALEV